MSTAAAPHPGHRWAFLRVVAALSEAGCGPPRCGLWWHCPCPGHGKQRGDLHGSLRVALTPRGVMMRCYAGCKFDDVLHALGLAAADDIKVVYPVGWNEAR